MKQMPKTVTRQVKVLRNPNPTFVSLVEHGAIQESFKVLKRANPKGQDMAIQKRDTVKKETAATPQPGVRKIVFHNSGYENEEAVRKFLDGNNYTDYVVKAVGDTFVAEAKDVADEQFVDGTIKTVKMVDDGSVIGYVGKLAEQTEKAEKQEEAQPEKAVKMDYWNMYDSNESSVSGVIKDGMSDGVPPGFNEIISATAIAIGNTLKQAGSGRSKTISSIGGEFATMVNKTADLYEKALEKGAKQTDNTQKFVTQFRDGLEELVAKAKAKEPDEDDKPKQKKKKEDEPAPVVEEEKKDETVVQAPAQIDPQTLAALIGKAIGDAVKPITQQLDGLTKKVDTVQDISEDARNKATKAAEEVAAVASQAPTKKSVTEQGNHSKSEEDRRKSVELAQKEGYNRFSNALGLRR